MKELERQLKALANFRRLQILKYLEKVHSASVGDIAREIRLSLKSTSRHLAILRASEIVSTNQQRLVVFYSLTNPRPSLLKQILTMC